MVLIIQDEPKYEKMDYRKLKNFFDEKFYMKSRFIFFKYLISYRKMFFPIFLVFGRLVVIDIFLVISCMIMRSYKNNFLSYVIHWIIIFVLSSFVIRIFYNLITISNKITFDLEKEILFNFPTNYKHCQLFVSKIRSLKCLYRLEDGFIFITNLSLYPIRFYIFGYLFCNKLSDCLKIVFMIIYLIIICFLLEYLKFKFFLIPKKKRLLHQIDYFFDNLKSFFLLKNHRKVYEKKLRKITSMKCFVKNSVNYVFNSFEYFLVLNYSLKITDYLMKNSRKEYQIFRESNNSFFLQLWLSLYLIHSIKLVGSIIHFFSGYNIIIDLHSRLEKNSLFEKFNYEKKDCTKISDDRELSNISPIRKRIKSEIINLQLEPSNFEYVSHSNDLNDPLIFKQCKLNEVSSLSSPELNKKKYFGFLDPKTDSKEFRVNKLGDNDILLILNDLSLLYSKVGNDDELSNFTSAKKYPKFLFLYNQILRCLKNIYNYPNEIYPTVSTDSILQIKNISFSVKRNEFTVILGSSFSGKTLLTKYLSGFPQIICYEERTDNLINANKPNIYLFNDIMLTLVSNFYENYDTRFNLNPLEFILSGKPFKKDIFQFIFKLLILEEYFEYREYSKDHLEGVPENSFTISRLYFSTKDQQEFIEAKILLQLSQLIYSILISKERNSDSIIIIDNVFDILLPCTCLKTINNLISNTSRLRNYNLSFIVMLNEDLEPFLSFKTDQIDCVVNLFFLNEEGLSKIDLSVKENKNKDSSENFANLIPSIKDKINEIFLENVDTKKYEIDFKPFAFSKKVDFKTLETNFAFGTKYIILIYLLGFLSLLLKLVIFSNSNFGSKFHVMNYDFKGLFFFQILTFCSSTSFMNSGVNNVVNEVGNFLFGYIAIHSMLLNNDEMINLNPSISTLNKNVFSNDKTILGNDILELAKTFAENNYQSLHFIRYKGKQTLKTSSLFYKKYFRDLQLVNIPEVEPIGIKNALRISQLIEKKLTEDESSRITASEKFSNNESSNKSISILDYQVIKLFAALFFVDIILKYIILLLITFRNINGGIIFNYDYLKCLLSLIERLDDPISVINEIYMRKKTFSFYALNEMNYKKKFIINYYLTLIRNLNLLLIMIFMVLNMKNSTRIFSPVVILNICFVALMTISTNKFALSLIKNLKIDILRENLGLCSYSYDLWHYLNINNISWWFKKEMINSLSDYSNILRYRYKCFEKIQFFSFFSAFIVSLIILMMNYKQTGYQTSVYLTLIFPPLLIFQSASIQVLHMPESSNNSLKSNNIGNFLKKLQRLFLFNTNYITLKTNAYSLNTSSRKSDTVYSSNGSNENSSNNLELQFSSPTSIYSEKSDDLIFCKNSVFIKLNHVNLYLVDSRTIIKNSFTFGSAYSPLFPINFVEKKTDNSRFSKIAIISNHNYFNFDLKIRNIIDPKNLFCSNYQLLEILKILHLVPSNLEEVELPNILDLSIIEFYKLYKRHYKSQNEVEFNSKDKNFNTQYESLKINDPKYRFFVLHSYSNFQKYLFLGHYILYSKHYKTLIIHLSFSMDANVWFLLIKKYIIEHKYSSIKDIIIVTSNYESFQMEII